MTEGVMLHTVAMKVPAAVQSFVEMVKVSPAVHAIGYRRRDDGYIICTVLSTDDLNAERNVIEKETKWLKKFPDEKAKVTFDTLRDPAARDDLIENGFTIIYEAGD